MGRKRKAWLQNGTGVRIERGKRLPGYYACWREFRRGARPILHRRRFEKFRHARAFITRHNARSDLKMIGELVPITLGEASGEFIATKSRKALSTQRQYSYSVSALIRAIGDVVVSSIDGSHVDHFLFSKKVTTATLNKHSRNLHAFFEWCRRQGYIDSNPVRDAETAERKIVARRRPPVNDAMVAKILGALEPESDHWLAVLIAATAAIDRTEIEQLKPEWVDVEAGLIRGTRSKSSKPFAKPLHPQILSRLALRAQRVPAGSPLLPGLLPRRDASKRDWWSIACEAAGVGPDILFRDLRAYATRWLMGARGMTLRDAQTLLQHSSIHTTAAHYDIPDPSISKAIRSLPLPGDRASGKRRSKEGKSRRLAL